MVFRLAIKAAGLFILVQALPQLVYEFAHHIGWFVAVARGGNLWSYDWIYRMRSIALIGLLIGCGLYLLFGGTWVLNKCVPLGALCDVCGYNVARCTGERCPECGSKLPAHPEQSSNG
jgi:hypothetical protein